MCGIAGIFGSDWSIRELEAMQSVQNHRGPDDCGIFLDPLHIAGMAHNRLSIIDLSAAGKQPMESADGNFIIIFNGEIYNYLELRRELESEYAFKTRTDTEVLLAGYQKWGAKVLDRLIGMFAFIIWDKREKIMFAARDRFGVKPLYFHRRNNATIILASEIKAFRAANIQLRPNVKIWAEYLAYGLTDHSEKTFWEDIYALPAGHFLMWRRGLTKIERWYDLAEKAGRHFDNRPEAEIEEEYFELLKEAVSLRFRADVPIGINLSGGVDSSALLGLVDSLKKDESAVSAFTFTTGDQRYDELPWVREMLAKTNHPLIIAKLSPEEVPSIAASVQFSQDEPFGGLPVLAYAKLFETAREHKTIVLLDGNGLDEQWAGYDYYKSLDGHFPAIVQGITGLGVKPDCLTAEFRLRAENHQFPEPFPDALRNAQYRDTRYTKIPRAMRFNDRISMRVSTELREPFLDHRLFELAFRQPVKHKIENRIQKKMLRKIVRKLLPDGLADAAKRPLQTPQREWLRGNLRDWANDCIEDALNDFGGSWLDQKAVRREWKNFCAGESDNSFYIWQWISLSLTKQHSKFQTGEFHFEPTHRSQSLQSI